MLAKLAGDVAARRVSAVRLVNEALGRVAARDPDLNAVVALRRDEALAEAAVLDRQLTDGAAPGPLCGLPLLVKDLEDVTGMVTTAGSLLFAQHPPATRDSRTVQRLRAAGAIVVGKANLPEFATEGYTSNLLFGTTGNPWAPQWSPGGSSGGSAAALAAGMVPLATATDGGGSVRIPAAFCGLLGIKPTRGVVGRRPIHDWLDLSTDGPLATTVADLELLLRLLAGPEPGDAEAVGLDVSDRGPVTAVYAAHRTADLAALPPDVVRVFEAAVGAMADILGLRVRWLDPATVFEGINPDHDWFTLATADHVASLGREWVVEGRPRMHPGAAEFMSQGLDVDIDGYLAARRRRHDHTRRLDGLLGAAAILLTPTVAATGWLADGRLDADSEPAALPQSCYSTAMQNLTGHPAISLPAGRLTTGVPFGLQVTGPRFADILLLSVARAWEAAYPWPQSAPGHSPFHDLEG